MHFYSPLILQSETIITSMISLDPHSNPLYDNTVNTISIIQKKLLNKREKIPSKYFIQLDSREEL